MSDPIDLELDLDDLPSPPGVAVRLLEIFEDPDATIDDFAEVICADAALAAKVIEFCNSPMIGQRNKATNLQQAMVVLGLRAVKLIALSFSLVQSDNSADSDFDLKDFWKLSFATALIAKKLFGLAGKNGDDAFLVGLMLNIGHLALYSAKPAEYMEVLAKNREVELVKRSSNLAQECEARWSGHQYHFGSQLLQYWNFPESIYSVLDKVDPSQDSSSSSQSDHQLYSISERLAILTNSEDFTTDDIEQLKNDAMTRLEKSEAEFEELFDSIVVEWNEYANMLDLDNVEMIDIRGLEKRARKTSRALSLVMDVENQSIQDENTNLKSEALVDPLTGVRNRRSYQREAQHELTRVRSASQGAGVVVADIDHFKRVNDDFGHPAGDAVLANVARLLEGSLRANDRIYRIGGEEFVILLIDCDMDSATFVCERIREVVASSPVMFEDKVIDVTLSQGLVVVPATCDLPLDKIFQLADQLLYDAKTNGRNRVQADWVTNLLNRSDCQAASQ